MIVGDLDEGVAAVNALAPEHVEVMTRRADAVARRVVGGAVFVGPHAPVAVGDYGIGPNHVLPTGGSARFASPLSVRDFQRRQSVVTLTRRGLSGVTEDVVRVAMAEGFRGHAQSVLTRFEGVTSRTVSSPLPCSAWARRSAATCPGSAVSSASTTISLGPASLSISTCPRTRRLAAATKALPGPTILSTAAIVRVP